MSCGDCDWGCVVPGCGRKMTHCPKHVDDLKDRLEKFQAIVAKAKAAVEWTRKHDPVECGHGVVRTECRACWNEPEPFPVGIDEWCALSGALVDAGLIENTLTRQASQRQGDPQEK